MSRQRFALSLELMPPAAWERFEDLASVFLRAEFPSIRRTSAPAGDRSIDALLWQPEGDPATVLQYSVTANWKDKIVSTARRIRENFPESLILIYVTNQKTGPEVHDLRVRLLREFRLHLDVRDREWFLDTMPLSPTTLEAAEGLAREFADPLLASRDIVVGKARALTTEEARAAILYLTMQWEDDIREKGLTKLVFDALIRATLMGTDNDNRLSREEVRRRIAALLPTHEPEAVHAYVDSALLRLSKVYIRHWKASDEFCLSHEELVRQRERLAILEGADREFLSALSDALALQAEILGVEVAEEDQGPLSEAARTLLERYLLTRGEAFVAAVKSGEVSQPVAEELETLVIKFVSEGGSTGSVRGEAVPLLGGALETLMSAPGPRIQAYLRSVADAYTLFAFLRETPDVQLAVSKMFSDGELWLDASVLLPVFAEELLPEQHRQYTILLSAAREAGLRLRITPGVLEEIERHMNKCLSYVRQRHERWEGRIPFLYLAYIWSGRPPDGFASWLERFRGEVMPEQDVADYLRETLGIAVESMEEEVNQAPDDFRIAVHEYWSEVQDYRRRAEPDRMLVATLASHDVENYLGVIEKRRQQGEAPFGYSSWWVTLDRAAYRAAESIRDRCDSRFSSPVLSPDFLINYLAVGPVRRALAKGTEARLPLMMRDLQALEVLPQELVEAADVFRTQLDGQPPHVVRRRVRDFLVRAQETIGPLGAGGVAGMQEAIRLLLAHYSLAPTRSQEG